MVEKVWGKMWWRKCGGKGHILHDPPLRNLGLLVQHVEPRAKKKNPKGEKKILVKYTKKNTKTT